MRRRTLLGALALGVLACGAPAPQGAAAGPPSGPAGERLHLLVDPRETGSLACAAHGVHPVRAVHELPEHFDLDWARALFARLRADGAALRGITRAADHFVLRQIAFDQGFLPALEETLDATGMPLVRWTVAPPAAPAAPAGLA